MGLVDEALLKGQMSAFKAYQLKAQITYLNTEDDAAAAMWLRKALGQKEAQEPETRTDLLYHLATILKGSKDYTACLTTCKEGKELAHSIGHTYRQNAFDFMAGTCLFDMGEEESGLKLMKTAFEGASSAAKSEEEYGHLLYFISTLINDRISVKDYQSALEECEVYQEYINAMAARFPETPESFIDRSLFYLDTDRAVCYAGTGRKTEADDAFRKALKRAFANTENGKIIQVEYFSASGQPEKVIGIYKEIPYKDADTVSRTYRRRLARLRDAYQNAGDGKKASEYEARYMALSEQIKAKEQAEGTWTKAAEYDGQNYRLALSDTENLLEKYHRHIYIALILLALAVTVLLIINNRLSKLKEARFNKQAEVLKKDVKSLQKQVSLITERQLYKGDVTKNKPSLEQLIEGKRLYLRKDINRDNAIALLGISHADMTRLLNNIQNGLSFPEYIKGLRIRYALELLSANPDIPVAELADRSGFYTIRTLQRSFLSVTGKTPSEYAKELKRQILSKETKE